MSRTTRVFALMASGFVLVSSAAVLASQAPAPAVSVVGFVVDSDSRLSPNAANAMTDKLAVDLVESGRFRVLDRAWLGTDALSVERSPIARIRDSASAAGVDYIIVGRVATVSPRQRYARPRPGILSPIGRPFAGYAQVNPRVVSRGSDYLRVSLEVVDTKTGSVLTETSSTCPVPPKSAPRVTPLVWLPASPVLAAAAAIAHSRKSAPSLDPGIERAVTAAGQVILRWHPQSSGSK
jgi:curli biogenesis system outer membrane secretion channel CsgG